MRYAASPYGAGRRMRCTPSWIWNVRCAWPSEGSAVTSGYASAALPGRAEVVRAVDAAVDGAPQRVATAAEAPRVADLRPRLRQQVHGVVRDAGVRAAGRAAVRGAVGGVEGEADRVAVGAADRRPDEAVGTHRRRAPGTPGRRRVDGADQDLGRRGGEAALEAGELAGQELGDDDRGGARGGAGRHDGVRVGADRRHAAASRAASRPARRRAASARVTIWPLGSGVSRNSSRRFGGSHAPLRASSSRKATKPGP